jgi:hypothetical protein
LAFPAVVLQNGDEGRGLETLASATTGCSRARSSGAAPPRRDVYFFRTPFSQV